jgi:hypothetical protein
LVGSKDINRKVQRQKLSKGSLDGKKSGYATKTTAVTKPFNYPTLRATKTTAVTKPFNYPTLRTTWFGKNPKVATHTKAQTTRFQYYKISYQYLIKIKFVMNQRQFSNFSCGILIAFGQKTG